MSTRFQTFKKVIDNVYGKYETSGWKPKAYTDNKSRYLWTDAYGVCNYITLYNETKDTQYLNAAKALIQDVHNTLGKDRVGRHRLGSSTDEDPLLGGLRIGKIDEEGTPDGDGQYFHYLTKWMFALNRMSIATNDYNYNRLAIQLAASIHPHFVYNRESNRPRMYWKISIDMSKPLTRSEGNLDPYDGYITYRILRDHSPDNSILHQEIKDMEKMVNSKYENYSSDDPLDLGEAVWISHWYPDEAWSKSLATKSLTSLENLWKQGLFQTSPSYRLAFREFGTTLGTQCNPLSRSRWADRVESIHAFWDKRINSRDNDITPIMYCSSLIPGVLCKDAHNKS